MRLSLLNFYDISLKELFILRIEKIFGAKYNDCDKVVNDIVTFAEQAPGSKPPIDKGAAESWGLIFY